jgi:hypothetical protein
LAATDICRATSQSTSPFNRAGTDDGRADPDEYRIVPENRGVPAPRAIGPVRRRSGANSWRVFATAEENLYVERYIISSWAMRAPASA